jgi:hypothetical protein
VEHDPKSDATEFCRTYFNKGSLSSLGEVNIDWRKIVEWVKERPGSYAVSKDLIDFAERGFDVGGMDKVNVHMKLESRMKDSLYNAVTNDMPGSIEEQRVRLIVWQRKGITAIFSSLFMDVKDNLKRCLKHNVIYTDGLTPAQISAILNKVDASGCVIAEDDLKKQDRQTDRTLIDTEMEIYKKLGANHDVVNLWARVHNNWRAKGMGVSFTGDASRHTGQATTALGNALVNLLVKMRLVKNLGNRLKIMMILGDDNVMLCKPPLTREMISLNSARHFNMKSEPYISNCVGTFLRMIVYKNSNNQFECGPDYIRLRRRHEVLNGVAEASDENYTARCMSYCCMMGDLEPVRELVKSKGWPIELTMWYEARSLIKYTAIKYNCSEADVESNVTGLCNMMRNPILITRPKLMFTEKGH